MNNVWPEEKQRFIYCAHAWRCSESEEKRYDKKKSSPSAERGSSDPIATSLIEIPNVFQAN